MTEKKYLPKITKDTIRDISALGGWIVYAIIVFCLLIFQFYDISVLLIVGFLFTLGLSMVIRSLFYKDRPKKQEYGDWASKLDASSFPSLHAMRTTFLAVVIIANVNNIFFQLLTGVICFAVILSRVLLQKHYWIDVVAGFAFGLLLGFLGIAFF